MLLHVAVVRQARERAVQVILADKLTFWWLPRSQIADGHTLQGGERDVSLEVADWIVEEKRAEDRREAEEDSR